MFGRCRRRVTTDAGMSLCNVAGRPRREFRLGGFKKLRFDGNLRFDNRWLPTMHG